MRVSTRAARAHRVADERPGIVGEKPFGHQEHGFSSVEPAQPGQQGIEQLQGLGGFRARRIGQLVRLRRDGAGRIVPGTRRVISAGTIDRIGQDVLLTVDDDLHGFSLGQARPLNLVEQAHALASIRLRVLDFLDQLVTVAREAIVDDMPVGDDAAEVASPELLGKQVQRGSLCFLEPAGGHVRIVEHNHERSVNGVASRRPAPPTRGCGSECRCRRPTHRRSSGGGRAAGVAVDLPVAQLEVVH